MVRYARVSELTVWWGRGDLHLGQVETSPVPQIPVLGHNFIGDITTYLDFDT